MMRMGSNKKKLFAIIPAIVVGAAISHSCIDPFAAPRARRLCDETPIGSNIVDFRRRAQESVDDSRSLFRANSVFDSPKNNDGSLPSVTAVFVAFAFARQFCAVSYEGDRVTQKHTFQLD